MTDLSKVDTPALPTVTPTCSLTSYLQQQYPDYFQDVFGIPGSGGDVSQHRTDTADLAGQLECPQDVDQCQDTRMFSSIQGHNLMENVNASSLGCGQETKAKSTTSTKQKPMKVNVCNTSQVNVPHVYLSTRHPLLTCATESAVTDLNRQLDLWLGKLKTDIQADFSKIIIQALEAQRQCHQMETIEMMAERQHLEWKVNELTDRVHAGSECLQEKDAVIDHMLEVLAGHKNRQVLALAICHTKAGHMQENAERYAECLATLHYEQHLTQKVLRAWFGWVKHRWRTTVEALCQEQAENTCRQLTCDYQKNMATLHEEITRLKLQLEQMQQERQLYVVHVKKAFLRGVCALNTETMSAFSLEQGQASASNTETRNASNSSNDELDLPETDQHVM